MIFQDTQPPFGPTPNELFVRYFHDLTNKTWGNISPLYRLDAFDWTILILYFMILGVLAIYGGYRIKQVIDFWRYRKFIPHPKESFSEEDLPIMQISRSFNPGSDDGRKGKLNRTIVGRGEGKGWKGAEVLSVGIRGKG